MAGRLPMGQKELVRSKVLEMVKQGKLTLKPACFKSSKPKVASKA